MRIESLSSRMAEGTVTAAALVETCLARIAADDATLHAFSAVFADPARTRAQALDAERAAGQVRGPLHGIPVAVKELADIAGHPTAFGSHAYAHGPAPRNATFIDRLEAAGAIILGTTHMVEFAFGSWGTNHARGTPWNPADRAVHRVPGGSSSGSAVAVAAGLVPAAIGSDTGGSVRIPAGLCGTVGFKPSYGLIPVDGVAPLGPTFDTIGPLTHDVAGARDLFNAMAGCAARAAPVALETQSLAVIADEFLQPIDPQTHAAYHGFLDRLRRDGARIETIRLPRTLVELQQLSGDIFAYEAYLHLRAIIEDPDTPLDPFVRSRALGGKRITADRHAELMAERAAEVRRFAGDFDGFDALVLPTTPLPAPPLAEVDENTIPMSRYTRLANCLDLCGLSLPMPVPQGAMPIGVQLCALSGRDEALLNLCEALDRPAG
ncbi:MAG: amidase [Rhodospirillaceae bacterium]|nr:amidase [Rhodospirillaceae bacterium]